MMMKTANFHRPSGAMFTKTVDLFTCIELNVTSTTLCLLLLCVLDILPDNTE